MDFVVPKKLVSKGARTKRRSSILKTTRPLEEIQNVSCGDDKFGKNRRVSFANIIEIKEFSKEKPASTDEVPDTSDEKSTKVKNTGIVVDKATADGEIQISTPVKKKPRRISAATTDKIERLSIIPKLSPSPVDQDFEIYEDDVHVTTTAAKHDITLLEIPDSNPFSEQIGEEANCFGAVAESSLAVDLNDKPPHSTVPSLNSDMELTLVDMSLTCVEPVTCTDCPVNELQVDTDPDRNPGAKSTVDNYQKLNGDTEDVTCSCAPEQSMLTPNKPSLDMSLELPEDSVQKTLLSSLKKKNSTTPHTGMFVPSSIIPATTYQLPQASHVFLEPKLMSNSNSVKAKDHQSESSRVHESETTDVEVVDMQLEATLNETRASQVTLITESDRDQVPANSHSLVTSKEDSLTDRARDETPSDIIWLHNVEHLHISEDPCLVHVNESSGVLEATVPSTMSIPPCQADSAQHGQTSEFLKMGQAISNLKSGSISRYDILDVNTPEAIMGERNTAISTSVLTHIGPSQEESIHSESLVNRQSVMMSPSAFSKILVKFNCDKTVVQDASLVQNDSTDAVVDEQQIILDEDVSSRYTKGASLENCVSTSQIVTSASETHSDHSNASETVLLSTSLGCSFKENSTDISTSASEPGVSIKPLKSSVKVSFADSIHIVQHRLTEVMNGLQARLSSPEYLKSHETIQPSLEKLLKATQNGLCVLNVLLRYGELSGLSSTYQWDWERVTRQLPSPILSKEDMTGSRKLKADWILSMHEELLLKFYPVITALMEEAARLYPWQLDELNEKQLQLTCSEFKITLQFEEHCFIAYGSSLHPLVTSVHICPDHRIIAGHRISEMMLKSRSMSDIAETLWSLKI